jgi:DNA-directed RNA polymerase specialized sigma24 family protein
MRNCVMLRVYQTRKYREIAKVLDISIQSVRYHLHKAKAKLKEKLGEYVDTVNLEEGEDDG